MLLETGQRGLLVGQTGSGKTQDAIFQLRNAKQWPVFIFDTKIEDDFFGLPEGEETLDLIEGYDEWEAYSKKPKKDFADYVLVRPLANEIQDFDILDKYTSLAYNKFGSGLFYFDEIYNWHNAGRAGNGLLGLLTRGRSKGKTVLMATQRPSWVSRFCITEVQKFFIHMLADARDKKTLAEVIPNFSITVNPPKFHFYHYEIGAMDSAALYAPVPYQKLDKKKIFSKKWF